jgi:hypothetical protein
MGAFSFPFLSITVALSTTEKANIVETENETKNSLPHGCVFTGVEQ